MRTRSVWALAAAVAVAALAAAPASGYQYSVSTPALITGTSPFSACTIGGAGNGIVYTNAEVEPQVAVDPASGKVVAVWQQDRWSNGSARALGIALSSDGGLSWGSPFFLPWSLCAGGVPPAGNFPRVTDPWTSFGPDGIGYQVALGINPVFPFQAETAITASRSLDGGLTWEAPQVILRERFAAPPFPLNDKESVTADPTRPGYAYAVWDRVRFPSEQEALQGAIHSYFEARSFRGDAMFSRTTNGGASWEPARSIMPTNANLFTIGNQIAVTGDRTLVDVFQLTVGSGRQPDTQLKFGALISSDAGESWSRVIEIADDQSVPVRDPDDGDPVRAAPELPDVASDLGQAGTLYAVWADGRFSGGVRSEILFTKSTDGGLHWSLPVRINQTPATANPLDGQAFLPAITVSADGTIAVVYYDFRFNSPDPDTLPTAAFLVHSHDGGLSWEEAQVSAPFDLETAPVSEGRGYFIGDYVGLAARGRDLVAVFPITNDGIVTNRTDMVSVRAGAP